MLRFISMCHLIIQDGVKNDSEHKLYFINKQNQGCNFKSPWYDACCDIRHCVLWARISVFHLSLLECNLVLLHNGINQGTVLYLFNSGWSLTPLHKISNSIAILYRGMLKRYINWSLGLSCTIKYCPFPHHIYWNYEVLLIFFNIVSIFLTEFSQLQ
jgi:hypothetical protein